MRGHLWTQSDANRRSIRQDTSTDVRHSCLRWNEVEVEYFFFEKKLFIQILRKLTHITRDRKLRSFAFFSFAQKIDSH